MKYQQSKLLLVDFRTGLLVHGSTASRILYLVPETVVSGRVPQSIESLLLGHVSACKRRFPKFLIANFFVESEGAVYFFTDHFFVGMTVFLAYLIGLFYMVKYLPN